MEPSAMFSAYSFPVSVEQMASFLRPKAEWVSTSSRSSDPGRWMPVKMRTACPTYAWRGVSKQHGARAAGGINAGLPLANHPRCH